MPIIAYCLNEDIILASSRLFQGGLLMPIDFHKSVTLRSGYDCDFTDNPKDTIFNGDIIILAGKLTIESGTVSVQ